MALIRKAAAGSDSFGNVWPEDGAVVEIDDPEQIAALMAITDAGFSEVAPSGKKTAKSEPEPEDEGGEQAEFSEVDPKTEASEAPKPAAKKTAAAKRAASKPQE